MTMPERRRFRRRNRPLDDLPDEDIAPVEPLETRAEGLARREAEASAVQAARRAEAARLQQQVEEEARRQQEAERRRAEARQAEAAARMAEVTRQAGAGHRVETGRVSSEPAHAKARRAQTAPRPTAPAVARPTAQSPAPLQQRGWDDLADFSVDARHLEHNRIVTAARQDPAHAAFDILRTKLLQGLADHGWKRVAITSPTKNCGKTFTAANLAISLSRHQNCRTLLLDCDLRRPTLHKVMGFRDPGSMGDMLRGLLPPERHLVRMGENAIHAAHNIAFGFNGAVEPYASELLQTPRTAETLRQVETLLRPDVVLFDLPPALYFDDVMAFRPLFDGVLLVIGGGITTDKEVREVERLLGENTPLLGMVLNKAEGTSLDKYTY
ncbi:CpsD/CapB family tyrosine-protein kinase [uncultured Salipiger sp.]|uniref:CpsD/CapB family tyrosine-protein kinase n=1 Tax=uncultured Salipiger sp. TaxID=499810 RepID=UPI0025948346|nr:CpsD/CapB family tyrosine-protein kinase [uncultured Salipiger sp.]